MKLRFWAVAAALSLTSLFVPVTGAGAAPAGHPGSGTATWVRSSRV